FIAVRDEDKPLILQTAKNFQALGYGLCATRGTAAYLAEHGIIAQPVNKVREGRPHIVDMIKNGEIALVINTSGSTGNEISDSQEIRRSALSQRVPQYTTVAGGEAISFGVKALSDTHVFSVQELHEQLKNH
ncbi:carbamoyl phosphate synthase large subunit, partial [Kingella kingae]|nr:carbamoyl phosphate synthase large subunit [Kingella kingae]